MYVHILKYTTWPILAWLYSAPKCCFIGLLLSFRDRPTRARQCEELGLTLKLGVFQKMFESTGKVHESQGRFWMKSEEGKGTSTLLTKRKGKQQRENKKK